MGMFAAMIGSTLISTIGQSVSAGRAQKRQIEAQERATSLLKNESAEAAAAANRRQSALTGPGSRRTTLLAGATRQADKHRTQVSRPTLLGAAG